MSTGNGVSSGMSLKRVTVRSAKYYQEELSEDEKDTLIALFEFLADCNGQLRNKKRIRNEGESLFAFKPKPHRFLAFFVRGKTVIVTHGFEKRQEKLPPSEKTKAQECRRDYEKRNTKGKYYDE